MKNVLIAAISLLGGCQMAAHAQASPGGSASDVNAISFQAKLTPASPTVTAHYGVLPLSFEANQGQTDPQVRFLSRGEGYSLFLTDSAAVLSLTKGDETAKRSVTPSSDRKVPAKSLKTDVVRMEIAGASHGLRVEGVEELPGKSNYFIGKDPAKWHSNVPTYSRVRYTGVYPGVDLVYYGNQRQLEYDFVVAPGADSKPVKLRFTGAEMLKLDSNGNLTIMAKDGEIAFHKPDVYQMKDGQREPVSGEFVLQARNTVGFRIGDYDHTRGLVIDPVLAYSTFLGGSASDTVNGIAVDCFGNAYVVGMAASMDFPVTSGAFQKLDKVSQKQVYTAFVTKLNSAGSALIYSTYLGGTNGHGYTPVTAYSSSSDGDAGFAIAVDETGHAYVTGSTFSADFPVTKGAFQESSGVRGSAFVTKLNAAGSGLIYSTYLSGGVNYAVGNGIAVDSDGNAYISGSETGSGFPVTPGAFQTIDKYDGDNGFVTKFNPTGTGLAYSTFFGGQSADCTGPKAITVDKYGQAYVTGSTIGDLTVSPDAFQPINKEVDGSYCTGFVAKLNAAGSGQLYSTYLGGSGYSDDDGSFGGDYGQSIAVDAKGQAYVAGYTFSFDFPTTPGAYQQNYEFFDSFPTYAPFVTKFNSTGSDLIYSTYLAQSEYSLSDESANSIAIDASGKAYVGGSDEAFLRILNAAGSALVDSQSLSQYSDGSNTNGIALDGLDNVYVGGGAGTGHITTPGALQETYPGATTQYSPGSGFVAKFAYSGGTTTSVTSDNESAKSGALVSFTATAISVNGTGVPAGVVDFLIDHHMTAQVSLDKDGKADYSTSDLSVGAHDVVASYLGDPSKYSASTGVLTETITGKVATPTFPIVGGTYKEPSVIIETATPGATIYYTTDLSTPSAASTKYISPIVTTSTTTFKAIAVANGDTSSGVATATYTISPTAAATSTTLTSSVNPSVLGEPVKFTAVVTAGAGKAVPTGSVTFKHGDVVMGSAALKNGVASFETSDLTLLKHDVSAVYTGSATYHASSSSISQQVNAE